MVRRLLRSPKVLILSPLLMTLLFIAACGGTAVEPIVVEQEVVKEIIKEVVVEKQVVVEKEVPIVVEKEVVKETIKEVVVVPTPFVAGAQTGQMVIPTAIPAPQSMAAPEVPDWVGIGATKHYKGDFPLVTSRNPGKWDLHYSGSQSSTLTPSGPRFNQLLEYNPVEPTEIIGDLAKTWEVSKDGTVYTFHLKDALWSDGTPVTADDIVFSLNRITLPDAIRARTGYLKRVIEHGAPEAVDEKTVKVPIKFSTAAFIPNLASDYMKMYPKALENVSQVDLNCCPEKSFGSGPYKFRDLEKDSSYSLERNDIYFKGPRPYFDALKIFIARKETRRLAALQAEQAYAIMSIWSCQPANCAQLEKDTKGRMRHLVRDATSARTMFLNISGPPFNDPRLRRAIYLAVDRPQLVERAFKGVGVPGTFFTPLYVEDPFDNRPGYRTNKEEDLAEARALMAQAGFPGGFKATINSLTSGQGLRTVEAVTAQLRDDVGIDFTISPKDLATFYVAMRDEENSASAVGTGLILRDPGDIINQFYDLNTDRNAGNWSDPRTDRLIGLQEVEFDPVKRKELIRQFAEVLQEGESHLVPLAWSSSGAVMDYRIRNFHLPSTIQLIRKWDHMWFDEDREMPTEPGIIP